MEVSKEDFAEFVSLLSEDDEDERAMLQALRSMQEAWADPEVRAAVESRHQAQLRDEVLFDQARSEGRAARLEGTNEQEAKELAEAYAKSVMAVWEEENPTNYPEPPWDDFARERSISKLQKWVRGHEDRVAARYFRASGLYSLMVECFLEGYNKPQES